ncbi:MAG: hypothetical protein ACLVE7_07795 [Coprococcus comes]
MNKWDLDACIHCGKCTRSCLFLEKYGIDLPVLKEKPELAYHCFLCGTCGCVCPKGIDGKRLHLTVGENWLKTEVGSFLIIHMTDCS